MGVCKSALGVQHPAYVPTTMPACILRQARSRRQSFGTCMRCLSARPRSASSALLMLAASITWLACMCIEARSRRQSLCTCKSICSQGRAQEQHPACAARLNNLADPYADMRRLSSELIDYQPHLQCAPLSEPRHPRTSNSTVSTSTVSSSTASCNSCFCGWPVAPAFRVGTGAPNSLAVSSTRAPCGSTCSCNEGLGGLTVSSTKSAKLGWLRKHHVQLSCLQHPRSKRLDWQLHHGFGQLDCEQHQCGEQPD